MNKLATLITLAAVAALTGCHTAHIEVGPDGTWSADIYDNFIRREFKGFKAEVAEGGKFKAEVNGYATDASEQLSAFTKEMWAGLGILGRIAASTINPVAASTPLTSEGAASSDVAAILKAQAELKQAVAELKKAAAATSQLPNSSTSQLSNSACPDGNCGDK